ncbi:hypothetical protein [Streptomyces laurentii]|uniref:hypothetical protein n=1 Tax=Streptomyces laurentii TaxID=39478 RepID=UPI0034003E61
MPTPPVAPTTSTRSPGRTFPVLATARAVKPVVAGYVPAASPELWRRYLAIIFDGLRPEGAHTPPQPPPDAL